MRSRSISKDPAKIIACFKQASASDRDENDSKKAVIRALGEKQWEGAPCSSWGGFKGELTWGLLSLSKIITKEAMSLSARFLFILEA